VVEIVKRYDLHKFVVLPKRWIVERTLTCISRNCRLARDFERYARIVATFASGIRASPRGLLCGLVKSKRGAKIEHFQRLAARYEKHALTFSPSSSLAPPTFGCVIMRL